MKATATPKQVEDLARKVDKLGESLSDTEKALLLGVFGMAQSYLTANARATPQAKSGATSPKLGDLQIEASTKGELPKLSEGLIAAFRPGLPGGVSGVSRGDDSDPGTDVDIGIGGPFICNWPKDG